MAEADDIINQALHPFLDMTQVNKEGKNVLHILSEKDWVDLAKLCLKKLEGEEDDKLKKFVNSSSKTGKLGLMFAIATFFISKGTSKQNLQSHFKVGLRSWRSQEMAESISPACSLRVGLT